MIAFWALTAALASGAAAKGPSQAVVEQEISKAAGNGPRRQRLIFGMQEHIIEEVQNWPQRPEGDDPEALRAYREALRANLQRYVAQSSAGKDEVEKRAARALIEIITQSAPPQAFAPPERVPEKPAGPPGEAVPAPPAARGPTGGTDNPYRFPPGLDARGELAEIRANEDGADARAQKDFGAINFYRGRDAEAMRYLGRAMENGDHSAGTLALYGRSAYHLGDYELAYQAGKAALAVDPSNADAEALYKLAHGRTSKINLPSALASVGLAAGGAASGAGAAFSAPGQAEAVDQAQRAQMAAAAARQGVVPPSRVRQSAAVTREAEQALRLGDYEGAYTRASQAIELNNQNAQAWNYRAMAASNMRRFSDAVYDSSYAINLEPSRAPAWVTRSWAFAEQGKYQEARSDALAALEKDPQNAYAFNDLAYALAGQNQRAPALDALRNAAQRDPRFKPQYEAALQLPENADMTLLFSGASARPDPAPAPPLPRSGRFWRLSALTFSGGLLVALGLLHIVSASWRERVHATIRRVLAAQAPSEAAALPSASPGGAFWEQYQMIRELGSGGMGVVYEARDRSLDRRVAVKRMRDEIRADPLERQRFVLEARTVAGLHHPNIVDIYAIVEQDQDVYLVFEYVGGRTLADALRGGPLSFAQARTLLAGACAAVEHAHKQKVIHRDLKPSNIMLGTDGAVKVMDFGVARQAKDALTKMSMTNTIVGTPPYMAPEQEQGTVRRESDVFALGVVLYESLCGELPFSGVGAGMLLNKINGRHQPLSARCRQALPPGLDAVIAKALAPDPELRYRTAAELLAAVEALGAPSAA